MKRLVVFLVVMTLAAVTVAVAGEHTGYSPTFAIDNVSGGTGANPPQEQLPVILLVRGLRPTGGPEQPAAYWWDMAQHLREKPRWARVVTVENDIFDGTGTVKAAGARLKGLVETYADGGSVDVYIVAHSMGGLVTRSCLSQMSSDHRRWVKKVVMLSTPNCGSHVADVIVSLSGVTPGGWPKNYHAALAYGINLLDPGRCSAVMDLQTERVLDYGRDWRDNGDKYSLLGGTSNSGLMYKAGSAVLAYWPIGTVNENDGMVTRMSAWGQSWSGSVFGRRITQHLPSATMNQYHLNHTEMKMNPSLMRDVTSILRNTYTAASSALAASQLEA